MSELFVFGIVALLAVVAIVVVAVVFGRGLSVKTTPEGHVNVKVEKPGGE